MKYILRLYVLGESQLSKVAIKNAKMICDEKLKGKYTLEVIDLLKRMQLAEDEKIFATPTLERKLPRPLKRIIGDLSDSSKVLLGLDIIEK